MCVFHSYAAVNSDRFVVTLAHTRDCLNYEKELTYFHTLCNYAIICIIGRMVNPYLEHFASREICCYYLMSLERKNSQRWDIPRVSSIVNIFDMSHLLTICRLAKQEFVLFHPIIITKWNFLFFALSLLLQFTLLIHKRELFFHECCTDFYVFLFSLIKWAGHGMLNLHCTRVFLEY